MVRQMGCRYVHYYTSNMKAHCLLPGARLPVPGGGNGALQRPDHHAVVPTVEGGASDG